ncbi:MAG: hypothetical protein ACKV2V_07210 [Blastocatellia bacterium]
MNVVLEEIKPEVAEALKRNASASGLSLNDYLLSLLTQQNAGSGELGMAGDPVTETPENSLAAFIQDLEELADGTEHLPPPTSRYSTEDIYFDHD